MASQAESELVLYDLSCIKNVCFSPVVWRIRMMLNYKRIAYKTVFLEFPDIEPTLKALGLQPASEDVPRYTVPVIHHLKTDTYLMGSYSIAKFIESTYPERAIPLESQLGDRVFANARALGQGAYLTSLMARESAILTPRAQNYFRETRETALNHALEAIADPGREEQDWVKSTDEFDALSELLRTNRAEGPFILGAQPSYADFFIAGNLQSARVIDEGVFNRLILFGGFKDVYEACLPFMERRD